MVLNQLHELILKFVENTDKPIFLTGKAGTGKTTFLHHIRTTVSKNMAVVAPTAVAAINAQGVTLHSFFQIPFGPLRPSTESSADQAPLKQINQEKAKVLRNLNLLIIDEISMVRADTLDYIDSILRQVRASSRPFGGVQLLMIGDPYQLPPVYQNDWPVLSKFYSGPYFFDSLVFNKFPFLTFELTQVFRQKDPVFIDILNGVRNGKSDSSMFAKLNARRQAVDTNVLTDYVTLSTHNKLVNDINQLRLSQLPGEAHVFKAIVSGEFPKEAFPAEEELVLKEGAFVMFIKNDTSGKKQYYNGRTGRVTSIEDRRIRITFPDDGSDIIASPEIWQNVKYALSDTDGKIKESSEGSFAQFPLRLAWAITIHKSQGLSFEKAIIDVSAAFAHGQTYVALSRCRSLEGVILNEPVKQENIFSDPLIVSFMQKALSEKPDMGLLNQTILDSDQQALLDLFDFSVLYGSWKLFQILLQTNVSEESALSDRSREVNTILTDEIVKVSNRFVKNDLSVLLTGSGIWQSDAAMDRLKKAAGYFFSILEKLGETIMLIYSEKISGDVTVDFYPGLNHLLLNLTMKKAAFDILPEASSGKDISDTLMLAGASFQPVILELNPKKRPKEIEIINPKLYEQLVAWREKIALQRGVQQYAFVSDAVLREISAKLPRSLSQLSQVKNFGEVKATDFGSELLRVIGNYLGENELLF
ncbi:HRDC domain-containing protein [Dyadobacter psychrotolerans]|uniref:Helicase n=1 Tax=Dyadobacter psychrotolerans TaxID=2541721 RepID=A0A4R5DTN3_9BACT|nr:HRDC domain-containing protein [Dyadobacter psychrotolerans]TDE17137.1 helicase [Dyadobacter psychrotolerans]